MKTYMNTGSTAMLSNERTYIAQTDAERNAIYEFRYRVYIEEMGKPYSYADHRRKRLTDPLDENATLLYCSSEGEIIGTVRINWGEDASTVSEFREPCNLEMFRCFPPGCLSFCSRLMVHKDHRYTAIALALSTAAYEIGRERGTQFNFAHCAPRLVKLFERMGFRQYAQSFEDVAAGEQVPLVLVIEDIAHLKATSSPFLPKALALPNNNSTGVWFARQFPKATLKRFPEIKETNPDHVFDMLPVPSPTA